MKKDLYILTGFLGAGKTTLLMHLLEHIRDRKIGIIQNEFGKVGIDGELIRRGDIEMIEINRGSIFCSCLKLSFVQALADMGAMELDCVFVESSGLADPSNIEEILDAVRELAGDVYELKGVICLVDAVNFPEQVKDTETVDRQLARCHMAVINKADLADETQIQKVAELVREINDSCLIEVCSRGEIELSFLGRDLAALRDIGFADSLNTPENKPKSFSLECEESVSREAMTSFLQAVLPECYRIKGIFRLDDGWQQVDTVESLMDMRPAAPREKSELVFLSKVGPKVIRTVDSAWKEKVGVPAKLRN